MICCFQQSSQLNVSIALGFRESRFGPDPRCTKHVDLPAMSEGFSGTQHHPSGLATCEESRCCLASLHGSLHVRCFGLWLSAHKRNPWLAQLQGCYWVSVSVLSAACVHAPPAHPEEEDSDGKAALPFWSHHGAQQWLSQKE